MKTNIKHISKLMSLVLRHDPSVLGITLDKNGWASVDELILGINKKGKEIDHDFLVEVIETNNKKRFAFNEDKTKIRASQGHSISVDVELDEEVPPSILYHGTVDKFLDLIMDGGLKKMSRQHVHLSHEMATATNVGSRRGKPVILTIDSGKMHQDGVKFYKSANGVWLVDSVEPKYIKVLP